MLKKIYTRLLTDYPLVWNTRMPWVIGVALLIHLLFFWGGFGSITAFSLQEHNYLSSVISGSLMTFSVLCSIALVIIWLVFYLRNNAYKSFYIIDKYHLAKEFLISTIILFIAITFFESYKWGAWLKTRSITSKTQLAKEANILNLGRAFIPIDKSDYFKHFHCDQDEYRPTIYNENINYFDSTRSDYDELNNVLLRKELQEKGAFSYKNYCTEFIGLTGYKDFVPAKEWRATKNRWINNHNADSIKQVLENCIAICKKYNIEQHIEPEEMTKQVFIDSFNSVSHFFGHNNSSGNYDMVNYFDDYKLRNVLEFIDDCQLNSRNSDEPSTILTVEIYFALCMSILLFCYRLFNKKVFLISLIGTIVWSILFILIGVSSESASNTSVFYILFFAIFLIVAAIQLNSGDNKTITGVLLNWHAYMLPFVILLITFLIQDAYQKHESAYTDYSHMVDKVLMAQKFPIGYWVNNNGELLGRLNLLLVFLYIAFFFTYLSKKWHIMPEE